MLKRSLREGAEGCERTWEAEAGRPQAEEAASPQHHRDGRRRARLGGGGGVEIVERSSTEPT
jgi:hypothetical protein